MSSGGGWSGLPVDLLNKIAGDIKDAVDFVRFGAVCRSFGSVVTSSELLFSLLLSRLPSLLLPPSPSNNPDSLCLYNLINKRQYEIQPEIVTGSGDLVCIGSSHGFLIIVDKSSSSWKTALFDPLTRSRYPLPSASTLPFFNVTALPSAFFKKVIVSGDPSTVAVIHDVGSLAIACVGDLSWTSLTYGGLIYDDIIFRKGYVYAMNTIGQFCLFDLRDFSRPPIYFAPQTSPRLPGGTVVPTSFMVESPDGKGLFFVCRVKPESFKVFRLIETADPTVWPGYGWAEMADGIGDLAMFLGSNHSVAYSVRDFPRLKRNSIYFAGREAKVFNLEDGSVEALFSPQDNPGCSSSMLWFVPKP